MTTTPNPAAPLYGLVRGKDWIGGGALPGDPDGSLSPWICRLVDLRSMELIWKPGLRRVTKDEAWLTTSLELALQRAALLPLTPGGFRVNVQRWTP